MRLLALLVPLLGLLELCACFWWQTRAPRPGEWSRAVELVDRLRQPGDLVVVAPAWAEPLARRVLGDERLPLADVARADESNYRYALELSVLGARASELAGWRELARATDGTFVLRRLAQPHPEPALYRALDHVRPGALTVATEVWGIEQPCPFTDAAPPFAGGLGGSLARSRARFRCADEPSWFVGISVIDDAQYRSRRCLAARPPGAGVLRLTFHDVPLGQRLVGYAGSSYLLARSAAETSGVELSVFAAGELLGRHFSRDRDGFHAFAIDSAGRQGTRSDVVVELRSDPRRDRDFCFLLETR